MSRILAKKSTKRELKIIIEKKIPRSDRIQALDWELTHFVGDVTWWFWRPIAVQLYLTRRVPQSSFPDLYSRDVGKSYIEHSKPKVDPYRYESTLARFVQVRVFKLLRLRYEISKKNHKLGSLEKFWLLQTSSCTAKYEIVL